MSTFWKVYALWFGLAAASAQWRCIIAWRLQPPPFHAPRRTRPINANDVSPSHRLTPKNPTRYDGHTRVVWRTRLHIRVVWWNGSGRVRSRDVLEYHGSFLISRVGLGRVSQEVRNQEKVFKISRVRSGQIKTSEHLFVAGRVGSDPWDLTWPTKRRWRPQSVSRGSRNTPPWCLALWDRGVDNCS